MTGAATSAVRSAAVSGMKRHNKIGESSGEQVHSHRGAYRESLQGSTGPGAGNTSRKIASILISH